MSLVLIYVLIFFSVFPLEFCMTSNIKSQTVPSCDKHHFGYWYNMGHPAVLCVSFLIFKHVFRQKAKLVKLEESFSVY